MNYNLNNLDDKEFELLSIDLLSRLFDQRIERFKAGKDGGVDGRFYSSRNAEVIIQCKHWEKSGYSKLLAHLKKSEKAKVDKLNPCRYIFITSVGLSPKNKVDILNVFSPYIKIESDIFGKEDITDLLTKYKDIEEKHYKLWITSTNILNRILNNAIYGRSHFKIYDSTSFIKKYAETSNHQRAIRKLDDINTIIITGEPGVGKTTLADQVCLHYLTHDYNLFSILSLSEAESVYDENRKQIFYFDDFLGRNYLTALDSHTDSHIVTFIKRVRRDKNKKFILTSRSNIINQGKRLSDLFYHEKIEKNEYEIKIADLTELEKAKILYKHIWFSNLPEKYIDVLYNKAGYLKIIKHKNFNPRLISFITDFDRLESIPKESYWLYIESLLDNPADTWGNLFEIQLDEDLRLMVLLVCFNGSRINEKHLKNAWLDLSSLHEKTTTNIKNDESSILKVLTGSLLTRYIERDSSVVFYDLYTPSIADYILNKYVSDTKQLSLIIKSLRTEESIENITSMARNNLISSKVYQEILHTILKDYKYTYNQDLANYFLLVFFRYKMAIGSNNEGALYEFISSIDFSKATLGNPFYLVHLSNSITKIVLDEILVNNIIQVSLDAIIDDETLLEISKFIGNYETNVNLGSKEAFHEKVLEYWAECLYENLINDSVLNDYHEEHDEDEAFREACDYFERKIISYQVISLNDYFITDFVADNSNYMDILSDNRSNGYGYNNYDRPNKLSGSDETKLIHDLFER